MTLLLPAEQIEVLEEFAEVDGMSVTEAIQLSTSVSWSVPCNYDPSRCRRFTNRTQRRFAVDPVRLYGMQYGMGDTGTWRVNRPLGTLRIASVRFDGWPGPSSRPKYVASDVASSRCCSERRYWCSTPLFDGPAQHGARRRPITGSTMARC